MTICEAILGAAIFERAPVRGWNIPTEDSEAWRWITGSSLGLDKTRDRVEAVSRCDERRAAAAISRFSKPILNTRAGESQPRALLASGSYRLSLTTGAHVDDAPGWQTCQFCVAVVDGEPRGGATRPEKRREGTSIIGRERRARSGIGRIAARGSGRHIKATTGIITPRPSAVA